MQSLTNWVASTTEICFIPQSPGSQKSEVKGSEVDSLSGSLLGLEVAILSPCLRVLFPLCVSVS